MLYDQREGPRAGSRRSPWDTFALEGAPPFRVCFVTDDAGRASKIAGLYDDGHTDESPRTP